MPKRTDWEMKVRGIIRSEMARQVVSYAQVVERLGAISVPEDERNMRNKMSRGKFTAAFMLACLTAMGTSIIHLD